MYLDGVHSRSSPLPIQIGTVAEMRDLYRAAEARAARMRLLTVSGQELADADPTNIAERLARSADRLAFFLGSRDAQVIEGDGAEGIAIVAPGPARKPVARFCVDGIASLDAIEDIEDRDAVAMHLELLGATIDRIQRERERGALLATLREREQRLEHMVGRMFSAQEEERRRVSQELHDGVAQTATALARILEGVGEGQTEALPAAERDRLAGIARALVRELRAVIGGLRPTLLDDLGLQVALRSLADGLEEDGYQVSFCMADDASRLSPTVEIALFRVAQEAIANVRKHAGGPCAVAIALRIETGHLRLQIRDSGRGPSDRLDVGAGARPTGRHVGIDVMHERMSAIGGHLEWSAGADGGVTVTAHLPESA